MKWRNSTVIQSVEFTVVQLVHGLMVIWKDVIAKIFSCSVMFNKHMFTHIWLEEIFPCLQT